MLEMPTTALPISHSFLRSSFQKAMDSFKSTAPTEVALKSLVTAVNSLCRTLPPSKSHSTLILSPTPSSHRPSRHRLTLFRVFLSSFWTSIALFFLIFASILSLGSDAAPAKKENNNEIKAMDVSMDSSAPPLQLQIEAQAGGKQGLAFLPTVGPGLDFYYLNYRPSYDAGASKIDFWMLTPKGSQPPQSASLELMDEFGKVRLAVLVPEGTEVPQGLARKNEPFLWKSWQIPKELKADFDFSEKFRVLLKTSDAPRVAALTDNPTVAYPGSPNSGIAAAGVKEKNNNKRFELIEFLVKAKNKHVNALGNANTVHSASAQANAGSVVQDRQFKIKGLKANPGGKPNAAKMYINSVAPALLPATNTPTSNIGLGNDAKQTQATGADWTKSVPSLAVRLQKQQRVTLAMLVVLASSAALMCSAL